MPGKPRISERRQEFREKQQRESVRVLQVLAFMAIVLVFLIINLIKPDRAFSAEENRSLASRPAISREGIMDGSYFTKLNGYYADQFLLRDGFVKLKAAADRASGQRELSDIYIGKQSYLLAKPVPAETEQMQRVADAIKGFAEKHEDVNCHAMIVPDAATILANKLPANAPVHDQLADLQTMKSLLGEEIGWLDAAAALSDRVDEALYYRTDHHWTSYGAKEVFLDTAEALGIREPIKDYEDYLVSDSFEGTLASRSGIHRAKDEIHVYTPNGTDAEYYCYYPDTEEKSASMFHSEALNEKDQYTVFFGGNHPLVEIHTTADTGKSLLIFKDSYANSFVQFLYPYYDNIIMVDPRYYYNSTNNLIRENEITDVLVLYSADTLFEDTALADCLEAS